MTAHDLAEVVDGIGLDDLGVERADTVFDRQDSRCLSYGIEIGGRRWFVKTATDEHSAESLERGIRFHRAVRHESIVRPVRVFRSPELTVVYPWVRGTVLNHATTSGSDRSGLEQFRLLPIGPVRVAITDVLSAHERVAERQFVAVDFYDGCLLYDFESSTMHLIDLDLYRPGPFVLDADRLPDSRSYMAPEELQRGAVIDERTDVFGLGRMIHHLLDAPAGWRGSIEEARIVRRATHLAPERRYGGIGELKRAWLGARR